MNLVIALILTAAVLLPVLFVILRFSKSARVSVSKKMPWLYRSSVRKTLTKRRKAKAKAEADPSSPTEGWGWSLILLAVLGVALGLGLAGLIIWGIYSMFKGTSFGFSMNFPTVCIIIFSLFAILDLVLTGGNLEKEGEKFSWRKGWKKIRANIWFFFLWSFVVYLGNIFLWYLDTQAFYSLWKYKNADAPGGSWFHYIIMTVIVLSMVLMVNVKISALRACGGLLFAMSLGTWMYIWASSVNFPTVREIVRDRMQAPGSPIHNARVQSLLPSDTDEPEEVVILKGQSRTFVIKDVVGIDDVHFSYRFDGRGKPIDRPRGQKWSHNPKRNITYELTPLESDMIVKLRR